MASLATTLTKADRARVETTYAVVDRDEVFSVLDQYPFLVPILIEASRVIPHYFADVAHVTLELIPDREAMDRADLFAIIHTSGAMDEALHQLDRLDTEWWLAVAEQARGKLTIDVGTV